MTLFRWFILAQLRREPLRSTLTVVGVALGIAVVLAIRLSNASSMRGFTAALDAVSGRTALEIVGPGIGVDEELLAGMQWLQAFGRATPIIDGHVRLRPAGRSGAAWEPFRVLGLDMLQGEDLPGGGSSDAEAVAVLTAREALAIITDPQAILLTPTYAARHGIAVDDAVEILAGGRQTTLMVRDLLGDSLARVRDGNVAVMDIAIAQTLLRRVGVVDRVDIRLHDSIAVAAAESAIAAQLPPGLDVQRPARRGAHVEKMLAAFHFNLSALSSIALIVGLFLVYNTVSVSVITRRAEIGMLRTVGVARRTVLALFLGEAACFAVVGCALGVPLGWGLAHLTVRLTSSTVSAFWIAAQATVPPLEPTDLGLAFAAGLPLALAAAVVPALEAARMPPVAAVRNERNLQVRGRLPWRYPAVAVLSFAAAAWCAARPPVHGLPVFGVVAALFVLGGAALLTPVVLHAFAGRGRVVGGRGWKLAFVLARANLGASIRRVSISVAALAVSLAMMVAVAIMIGSFRTTVDYWVGQTLQADLFVSTGRSEPLGDPAVIPAAVERVVAAHPATVAIDAFRRIDVPYGEALVYVGSGRFDVLDEHGTLLFKSPARGRGVLRAAAEDDAVVVSESFALRHDRNVGDYVTLPTRVGDAALRIAGVYFDYGSDRGTIVMDAPMFERYYDDRRPSRLSVYLADGADPDRVRGEIQAALDADQPVFVATNAALRAQVLEIFDSTFAITHALDGIAIAVAMAGVATMLLTLVLERRRELAMLRLAGAEQRHLRQAIMVEAGLLGLVSLGIGGAVGAVLSVILIFVVNVQSFGWTIQFHLPMTWLVLSGLVVLAATVLAGLYPARLAGSMTLADRAGAE